MMHVAHRRQPIPFGLIGLGRIGRRIIERFSGEAGAPSLTAVLVRPGQRSAAEAVVGSERVCTSLDEFIARRPSVAVECASREIFASGAASILAAGIDLIPLSLAALADRDVETRIIAAATVGPGRLEIPPGAMGSLDVLAAASEDDLTRVVFRAAYPVARWRDSAAATMVDLDHVTNRTTFYRGSVRNIARLFPRHVNVAVGVALAGLGLDRTDAELIADPTLTQAEFEVDIAAGPGAVALRVLGRDAALGTDPADYTAFSVLRLLRRRQASIMI